MPYLTEEYFNPSSLYSRAQEVKNAIEEARKNVAEALGADHECQDSAGAFRYLRHNQRGAHGIRSGGQVREPHSKESQEHDPRILSRGDHSR